MNILCKPMNNKPVDIFTLVASEKDSQFVQNSINVEVDVMTELLSNIEDIPYLSSFIKLAKIGYSYCDFQFVRKLSRFLKQSEPISIEKKEQFLASLSQKKRHKIAGYLTYVLYTAEDEEKADVLGLIYKARLMDEINDEMMLRLIFVIGKIYVRDLRLIDVPEDKTIEEDCMIIANFNACGLIPDRTGVWIDEPFVRKKGSLSSIFNDAGNALYKILKNAEWFTESD